ncbi:MAG: DUF1287 domain-containing protein [Phenylobacterium sp.]
MLPRRAVIAAALSLPGLQACAQPLIDGGPPPVSLEPWAAKLIGAARTQLGRTVRYAPGYARIAYPMGDVPIEEGVCTDVVIRAYRSGLGVDLQRLVHEDMLKAFARYPHRWGLTQPDPNIDHRRVPNLETFLGRRGAALPLSVRGKDFLPGDIVTQRLPAPHVMIVADRLSLDRARPLVIHNIGWGARLEDALFAFPVVGHFRFPPAFATQRT